VQLHYKGHWFFALMSGTRTAFNTATGSAALAIQHKTGNQGIQQPPAPLRDSQHKTGFTSLTSSGSFCAVSQHNRKTILCVSKWRRFPNTTGRISHMNRQTRVADEATPVNRTAGGTNTLAAYIAGICWRRQLWLAIPCYSK